MFKTRSRSRLITFGVAISIAAATAIAFADHWSPSWRRPDRSIPFNTSGIGSEFWDAVNGATQQWDNNTAVSLWLTSGHGEIRYVEGYWGNTGWAGRAVCYEWNGSYCGWVRVLFNKSHGPYTQWQRRRLACHETGHALGLGHRGFSDSCLYDGSWRSNIPDAHDYSAVNLHY